MSQCPHSPETHALLSGESKDPDAARAHVANCDECQAEFSDGLQIALGMEAVKAQRDADRETAIALLDALHPRRRIGHPVDQVRIAAEAIGFARINAAAIERAACAAIAEEVGKAPKSRNGAPADWIQIRDRIKARGRK